VNAVDHLHPALTHHIVNSLGWGTLRPLQEESIEPILRGKHALLLAPTAGGKTEAAFFPVLSRMLSENWTGMSVLYVCPLKALLNSLHTRLEHYCKLVGRTCGVWHGDISASIKGEILEEPPDCLLTTPESLEVLLISSRIDKKAFFRDVRVVVVDEIHSFAGDDRGWHLISVLERLTKLSGREPQRIGLSATVGNATDLLQWLSGYCVGDGTIISPPSTDSKQPEVELDYVGTLTNAALVISRLHRGQKRLVFCDSRSRVEELTSLLRALGVETFVSHSSLSAEERRRAEAAFQTGTDCVIVATSTLELGIDVGDLDRVIQIDATTTVASFLQRMGRTGRRADSHRNCLFLATSSDALIRAAALIRLWREGFVEAVVPPVRPLHVFAQQIMALAIQQRGLGLQSWRSWLGRVPAFGLIAESETEEILGYMIENGILSNDHGTLWLGREGEQSFGWRNFRELFSVFNSPPMFMVKHGQIPLGEMHEHTFLLGNEERIELLLGGRSWEVTHIDWKGRVAYVHPTLARAKSHWPGDSPPLSFRLCRAIRGVLADREAPENWSRRATERMAEVREEFDWLDRSGTAAVTSRADGEFTWWTFGGKRANAALAERLREVTAHPFTFNNLSVELSGAISGEAFSEAIRSLRNDPPWRNPQSNLRRAIDGLKFGICIPPNLAEEMLQLRLADKEGVVTILSEEIKHLSV
jgi:ATP-dependent helicase Lhr and Lhr-like helicase